MELSLAGLGAYLATLSWLDALEAFFVAMSVIGQHFISQRDERGFIFWIASNIAALVFFAALGRWMTFTLYLYFLCMCVKGFVTWRQIRESEKVGNAPPTVNTNTEANPVTA